jgi:regulator of nucleoside diphosphate kinase
VPVYIVKLVRLLNSLRSVRQHDAHHIEALGQELEKAIIVDKTEVPRDVVTMNSRVRVRDLKTRADFVWSIVFPQAASAERNRVSVWRPSVLHCSVIGPATLSSGKFLPEPAG